MATGRALMTESEEEYLAGEYGDQRRYEAKSRIKSRIRNQLSEDMNHWEEHAPGLIDVLQEVVCEDRE